MSVVTETIVCTPALLTPELLKKAIMEKKAYIKPEIEVVEMEIESPMLTGSQDETLGFGGEFDFADTEKDQLSIGRGTRRGKWGNLWYTED